MPTEESPHRPHRATAVLWDMDGVLLNSGAQHYASWQEVFRTLGREYSYEDFISTFGLRSDTVLKRYAESLDPEERRRLVTMKDDFYWARLDRVTPQPGAIALVLQLKLQGLKQAVVSSAARKSIEMALGRLGLLAHMQAILGREDVDRGKPDPQGYLAAADRLAACPADCVVIEDAPGGVAGAREAGMRVVGLASSHKPEALSLADLVVPSLDDRRLLDFILGNRA